MLLIIRVIFVSIYCVLVCVIGSFYCLFSFRNPKNVAVFSHIFGRIAPIFGIKVEIRKPKELKKFGNAIYISNHQNTYDLITVSNILQPFTVTVGKKSLLWIPFFGQLYWLSGNLLINRNQYKKSHNTIKNIVSLFQRRRISIWIFPEGTRSRGRGLMPFKNGAFYAAISAGVPIIPVCVSNTSNKVNLNILNNGLVIVEMLKPIDTRQYKSSQVHELKTYCYKLMSIKINELNQEVLKREIEGKNLY